MKGLSYAFSDLSAGYDGTPVLRGLRGIIRPGLLTALIGPNGSGKSTFLRALAGLLPFRGTLRLGERDLSRVPRGELGRLVGVVPQQVRMASPFTVHEAVSLGRLPHQGLTARRSEEDGERVLNAVARSDVEHLLLRPVTRLSGGETQRVMLATVLAQDPPVMLLDEPASAQDPLRTARVFSLLRDLAAEGRTVIAALHDVNLAVTFADAFLAMKDGRIAFDAPIARLDGEILQDIYGAPFEAYLSERENKSERGNKEGGNKRWHVRV
ncbi:MAG: ABC transporter ATP-binding protein [Synergistaceae bacterium]|jgi:iron complex transport system ATP-binding protein|nr:ABC transporter ATP-binding protein [Synergistaceae bacterium]